MKPQAPLSELTLAFEPIKPVIYRAIGYSTLISLLALAPTVYMLEVYDRVVNSRSGMTLLMLTILIVMAYAVMELLEKVRGSLLRAAGVKVNEELSKRVYDAMFQGFLKKQVVGSIQILNDLKMVREFIASPALMAIFEAPVAILALALNFLISPYLGWGSVLGGAALVVVTLLKEKATRMPLIEANKSDAGAGPVSYTHLTLPTILRV